MNHKSMIKFYQRRRRQRLNRLGWITLAMAIATITATAILIIS
jgi:hypothetical protein